MKETPQYQEPFKVTINGKPAYFASNVTIACATNEDTTKDLDNFCIREHVSTDWSKPCQTSFTFEATVEPSLSFSRFVSRMLGRIRPNRGSSRTKNQRYFRMAHYWAKAGRPWCAKPRETLADYRKFGSN